MITGLYVGLLGHMFCLKMLCPQSWGKCGFWQRNIFIKKLFSLFFWSLNMLVLQALFFLPEWLWVEKQTCILHQFKGSLSEKLFGYQLHHHLTITFRTASICLTEVHFTRGNPGWWKWGAVTTPNRIWVFSHHVVVFLESGLVWSCKGDTVHTNYHGC